jgi:hypothetical protein
VVAILHSRFRSPGRPPVRSTVLGGWSLFSFNRTSGSCWRCKPVCRVKASIPGAIWATPPAPLPPRVRGHPRLQHRQPKFASSVTRLGASAAIGQSPRGVFFDGTVLFPAELPAIDCRPTIWRHDRDRALDCPRLMARQRMRPLQFWSMIVGLPCLPRK